MTDDKQAVTDPDPDDELAEETGRTGGDEPTLDEALKGIEDDNRQEPKPKPEPPKSTDLERELADLKAWQAKQEEKARNEDYRSGMNETVGSILKNEMISKVYDEEEIEGLIHTEYGKNPKLGIAFGKRYSDPAAWSKVVNGLVKKFEGKAAAKLSNRHEDQEAAIDAARGVSHEPPAVDSRVPKQSELASMSDAEFYKLKRGLADAG